MNEPINPLNQTHCDCLNRVLDSIPQSLELAQKCKDCGWPADDFIAQLNAQRDMAAKAKAHFFPNHP